MSNAQKTFGVVPRKPAAPGSNQAVEGQAGLAIPSHQVNRPAATASPICVMCKSKKHNGKYTFPSTFQHYYGKLKFCEAHFKQARNCAGTHKVCYNFDGIKCYKLLPIQEFVDSSAQGAITRSCSECRKKMRQRSARARG